MSDGAVKACGCGPLEPCKPHRDAGDLQDWEARARAAEDRLAAKQERAERDHEAGVRALVRAGAAIAEQRERAERAEARLADLRDLCREHGSTLTPGDVLRIIEEAS